MVRLDTLWSADRLVECLDGFVPSLRHLAHFAKVIVVVGERVIDVGHVEIEPVRDRLGVLATFLDERVDLADADSPPTDVRLAQDVTSDPLRIALCHTVYPPYNGKIVLLVVRRPDLNSRGTEKIQHGIETSHHNLHSSSLSTLSTRMSNQIRLEDHVYERIKANKRDDESFSEAVERLIGGRSLRDLREVFTDDQVAEMREAIEAADEQDREEVREVAERFE